MKLSSRLALFIAPVLLIGYLIIAYYIYITQCSITTTQARKQINGALQQLELSLEGQRVLLEQFLLSMPSASAFLSPSADDRQLKQEIDVKASYIGRSFSFVILDADKNIHFQHQHSVNGELAPNLTVHKNIIQHATSDATEGWMIHPASSPKTLVVSISDQHLNGDDVFKQNHFEMQIAVNSTQLFAIWEHVQQTYLAKISITDIPLLDESKHALTISRQLSHGRFLSIQPDAEYHQTLIRPLLRAHLLGFAVLLVLTITALFFTVRRFVGAPMKALTTNLSKLYGGTINDLKEVNRKDEIGALATRFHSLHKELAETYEQSRILAEYDPLTSLPNRSSFYSNAEEILRSAALYDQSIRLLYIDLDNYKQVNDKFGHDMGDELLVDFSRRLTRTLNNKFGERRCFAARLAGDEFAVLLPPNIKNVDVTKICEDILNLFDGGYWFARGRFAVTLSIGVASYPQDGNSISELVSNSDMAMYQAKAAGKNQYAYYSQDLAAKSRYLDDLERELRRANFDEEFHLTYMPIYNAQNKIVSCEALLRWRSPQLGEVSPADFVPVAETCGLFVQLDRWVLHNAFRDFRRLRSCFGNDFRLAINISSAELQSNDILDYIKEQFSFYGIQPSSIELEMTETFAISQHFIDGGLLYRLAELGVHITLDDFGTGFTSMLQLVEYPIGRIKLDRTFVTRIMKSDRQDLLPALIELCHAQNLSVTAEGVENQGIYNSVLSAECDCLQGYHLSKPKRLEDIEQHYKPALEHSI